MVEPEEEQVSLVGAMAELEGLGNRLGEVMEEMAERADTEQEEEFF